MRQANTMTTGTFASMTAINIFNPISRSALTPVWQTSSVILGIVLVLNLTCASAVALAADSATQKAAEAAANPKKEWDESGADYDVPDEQQLATPDNAIDSLQNSLETLDLTTDATKRILLNGVDKVQFENYLKIHQLLKLLKKPDGSLPSISEIPETIKEEYEVDNLSTYDRRVIKSIISLVTENKATSGSGHEILVIQSLTKGHRTASTKDETEVIPTEGVEPTTSAHYADKGQAVDVSALDYIRGTKFIIESEVEEKTGKVVSERVESIEHLPPEAIKFVWQSDDALSYPGAVPEILASSPHGAGQRAAENATLGLLKNEAELRGNELNVKSAEGVQNIGEMARSIGEESRLNNGEFAVKLGPHALLENAQKSLKDATGLPELSWRGEQIDGYRGLAYNAGAEQIGQRLGLDGAIVGKTSEEIIGNIGERVMEKALGDLPLGTLDGIPSGNTDALKIAVGRGVVAKQTNLWVSDLLKVNSIDDLKARQPTLVGYMASSATVLDNLFALNEDATKRLINRQLSWNDYLKLIGEKRLEILDYAKPDTALNLQEVEPLIGKDATQFMESLRKGERGLVDRFRRADTSVFVEIGDEYIAKTAFKDNDERAAFRTWQKTGTMPTVEGTSIPVIDLDTFAQRVGMFTGSDAYAFFIGNAPTPIIETVGRVALVPALTRDISKLSSQIQATSTSAASLTDRLKSARDALKTLRGNVPANLRGELDTALTATDELLTFAQEYGAYSKSTTATEWVTGVTKITSALNAVANADIRIPDAYRTASLAVAKAVDNKDAGELLYALPNINLGGVSSTAAIQSIRKALNKEQTPLESFRDIGGMILDSQQNLPRGTSRLFYDIIEAAVSDQKTPSTNAVNDAINNYANKNKDELAESGNALGLKKNGIGLVGEKLSLTASPRDVAYAMAGYMVQPTPTDIKSGANKIDTALGIDGYETAEGENGTYGLIKTKTGETLKNSMKDILADQKAFELMTGRSGVGLSKAEQENKYLAAAIRFGADQLGLPIKPDMLLDPKYKFSTEEIFLLLQSASGKSMEQLAKETGIPFLDMLTNPEVVDAIAKNQFFDLDSDFWKNGQFLGRLEAEAANRGLPADVVRALLDKKLTPKEQQKLLKDSFGNYLTARLTPDFVNDLFGLEGSDAAITADALSSVIQILLSDEKNPDGTPKDKGPAFKELGLKIGDSYFAEHYGVSVSWMFSDKSTKEKGQIGLRTVSTALGLDPSVTDMADTFYEVLLLDGKLDLESEEGKANVAKLITSFGNIAGVPGEYTVLAASALTGDIETTLTTYAGQAFVDKQLREFGVTDVSFRDIYEATTGLLPETKKEIEAAADQYTHDMLPGVVPVGPGQIYVDPETGETIQMAGGAEYEKFRKNEIVQRTQEMQAEKQKIVKYALSDALLHKALESQVPGINIRGFSKAMFEDDPDQKFTAFTGLAAQIAGSENAGMILGSVSAATELKNFFSSDKKDLAKVSPESLASIDGWLQQATGWDVPVGASGALLAFAKTHNTGTDVKGPDGQIIAYSFDSLLKSDYSQMKIGGFIDKTIGLPEGTTFTAWERYKQATEAWKAVDLAEISLAQAQVVSAEAVSNLRIAADAYAMQAGAMGAAAGSVGEAIGGETGAIIGDMLAADAQNISEAAAKAHEAAVQDYISQYESSKDARDALRNQMTDLQKSLSDAESAKQAAAEAAKKLQESINTSAINAAQLIMFGVNLVFGKQISKFESSLGLPPGTVSLIATAGIALAFGATFASVLSSVLLPGIGFMLFGLLGGGDLIMGLFGKKKTKKVKRVEILWSWKTSDPGGFTQPYNPETGQAVTLTSEEQEARTNMWYKQMLEEYNKKSEEEKKLYQPKPKTELNRGDWPEEVWYYSTQTKTDNSQDTQAKTDNSQDTKIIHPGVNIALVKDSDLPYGVFRGTTQKQFMAGAKQAANDKIGELIGNLLSLDDRTNDDTLLPTQIYTHQKQHFQIWEMLINEKYGADAGGAVGDYETSVKNGQRKGVIFDADAALLADHVHWQY